MTTIDIGVLVITLAGVLFNAGVVYATIRIATRSLHDHEKRIRILEDFKAEARGAAAVRAAADARTIFPGVR